MTGSDPRPRTARELAALCVADAARDGLTLVLTPETPVIPDEHFPWLTERGTWGEIDVLARHWSDIGCAWVNLRFAIEEVGAVIRYEAKPTDEPLPWGGPPQFNGGFDIHRIIGQREMLRRTLRRFPPAGDEGS